MKKVYVLYFAALCMLFVSCSPSLHFGKTSVEKPLMTETDASKWQRYYEDQLDAYGGNATAPEANYPEASKEGFKMAKTNWDEKVKKAKTNTALTWIGSVGAGVLLTLIIYNQYLQAQLHPH